MRWTRRPSLPCRAPLSFGDGGGEWIRIIYECRMFGHPTSPDTDPSVIVGPTAGKKVNEMFRHYRQVGARFESCIDDYSRRERPPIPNM